MKKILLTTIATLLITFTFAQNKILFKVNPTEGKTLNYEMLTITDIDGAQSMVMEMNILMSMTPTDITEDGLKLSTKMTHIKMDMDAGLMALSYDSSKEPSNQMEEMFAAQLKPLLATTMTTILDRFGNVKDVDLGSIDAQLFDDASMKNFSINYPNNPISIGESWTSESKIEKLSATAKTTNTFTEETTEGYKITTNTTLIDTNGNTIGNTLANSIVDKVTFLTISNSSEGTMDIQGNTIKVKSDMKRVN